MAGKVVARAVAAGIGALGGAAAWVNGSPAINSPRAAISRTTAVDAGRLGWRWVVEYARIGREGYPWVPRPWELGSFGTNTPAGDAAIDGSGSVRHEGISTAAHEYLLQMNLLTAMGQLGVGPPSESRRGLVPARENENS